MNFFAGQKRKLFKGLAFFFLLSILFLWSSLPGQENKPLILSSNFRASPQISRLADQVMFFLSDPG